jgi:DNA-binding transcriptional regulator YiaG
MARALIRPYTGGVGPDEVRALIERLDLTQEELAARLGVSQAAVSRWLRGLNRPTGLALRALQALAREASAA